MKKISLFVFTVLLGCSLLGCSSKSKEIYYAKFPDILDFGALSNIEAEVIEEEIYNSTSFIYQSNEKFNEKD